MTYDHVKMRDWVGHKGLTGKTDALNTLDLYTRWMTSDAVESKNTQENFRLLNHIRGSDYIQLMYSDGWKAFNTAARLLRVPLAKSQPGSPQTNAIMERCNQIVLRGTRAALFQALSSLVKTPWSDLKHSQEGLS